MKYDDLEEYSLLKLIYQGNHDAFWQLWLLHKDYLYHRCLSWMNGNHTEAENALSQASIKAYEKLPHYASKIINVKAWLTTLTHNLCLDIFFKKKQLYYKYFDSNKEVGNYQGYTRHTESIESILLHNELEIKIYQVINDLPSRLRSPCIMYFIGEMSYPDIAQKCDISVHNVYKRISDARKIIKKSLSEYLLGEDNSILENIALPSVKIEKTTDTNLKEAIKKDVQPILLIHLKLKVKICTIKGGNVFIVNLLTLVKMVREEESKIISVKNAIASLLSLILQKVMLPK